MHKKRYDICEDIIQTPDIHCSDYTDVHVCHKSDKHLRYTDGRRLHHCGLCSYQWEDEVTLTKQGPSPGQTTASGFEPHLCPTCHKPMEEDYFMGLKIWLCQECQEIEDDDNQKLPKDVLDKDGKSVAKYLGKTCPLGGDEHRAPSSECSYGHCEEHCKMYHSYMPRHRTDTSSTALAVVETPKKPEPQPLLIPENFFHPTDVDWR